MTTAMLLDIGRCIGCETCTAACALNRGVPVEEHTVLWTRIQGLETGHFPNVRVNFVKIACNHCTQAACVDVCPTGALYHHPDGFVVLDQDKCNGCGYCTQACPFHIPQLDVVNPFTGEAKANKCTFCVERTANGGATACSMACPFGAITFGDRDELIAKGKERVAALQAKGVSKARLYGENEMGGLHVLYVLEEEPEVYGLPANPQYPALVNVWQKIIQPLGNVAFGATIVGILGAFLIARRNIRMEEVK